MSKLRKKGGIFVGKSHAEGGIPVVVEDTGQHVEIEGDEPLIPREIKEDNAVRTREGSNLEIIHKINKKVGAKGMDEKATTVESGDMIVCKRAIYDKTKRKVKGTDTQIVSAINENAGCNKIESGGELVEPDGTKKKFAGGGRINASELSLDEIYELRDKVIFTKEFKNWFGDFEKAYKKAGLDFNDPAWDDVSKAVDNDGLPMVCYHGTTHKWNIYSDMKGNFDNDMGRGFYATSEFDDASRNYLSSGKDLQNRTTNYAEKLANEKGLEYDDPKVHVLARKKIVGKHETILPVFLKIKNPLFISDDWKTSTIFDFAPKEDEDGNYEDPEHLVEIHEAIRRASAKYNWSRMYSVDQFISHVSEQGVFDDETTAQKLINAMRSDNNLLDFLSLDDAPDELETPKFEFIKDIFIELGFDGVVYMNPDTRFKGMGISSGTRHYIAWTPTQIKLIKNKKFDANNPDIRFDDGGGIDDFEDSGEFAIFTKNTTIHETENVLSGKSEIKYGRPIQTLASYLRTSQRTSTKFRGSEFYKQEEARKLKSYAVENNLWVDPHSFKRFLAEGAEQQVYLSDDTHVVKASSAPFYTTWEDYFISLSLHNYFFPETAYKLIGFTQERGVFRCVVEQIYIKSTEPTNLESVKDFMEANGFRNIRNQDYVNENIGIILEDLHEANVLTKDGILRFIDTVFYLTPDSKIKFDKGGYVGSITDELSESEVEEILGRKIDSWKDDTVVIAGVLYEKCFLRPFYKISHGARK